MLILFDAGNTRLKWGVWGGARWQARGALENEALQDLDELLAPYAPTWIGVSCVAGAAVRQRIGDYADAHGIAPHWLVAEADRHGLHNAYRSPATLGADRYAALLACLQRGLAPCVVAMAGTALTVDALSATEGFLGGFILPGAALMRRALADGTAALANSPGVCQDFPDATANAVHSGIQAALGGAVAVMAARLATRTGETPRIVLAGGDAAWLRAGLEGEVHVIDDLVLEGLLCLAKHLAVAGA